LWRQVAELPQGTREAIFLYYYEGESVRAVARSLGLSLSGAKRRLQTAREELREKLWCGLEQCLRETLPSAREWKSKGRRLGLLVLASIPAAWTARAGATLAPSSGSDPIAILAHRTAALVRHAERPVLLGVGKKAALLSVLALLLFFVGRGVWHPDRQPAAPALSAPAARPQKVDAEQPPPDAKPQLRVVVAELPKKEEPPAAEEAPVDDASDSLHRGSVFVRVIWGDTRTSAPGVTGQVIPWGSPDLYIDERTFTTGPDGTARVEHLFKGGASVMLDRGGSADVRVEPGDEREVVVEVPPGINIEGSVVDQSGFAVGAARIWISYSGHMNWGSEVATSGADGSFFVRSISSAKYIAARADGHATSDLRPLEGEAGSTMEVRLVLNGAGGELEGTVRDEAGKPVPHAKVMVGAEYPNYTLLDDGATGFSPPPYLGFTDDEGYFHADSLALGKARVAVRAPGFVPLVDEIELERGTTARVELTLQRGATLTGHVTDAKGAPLTGAHVSVGDFRDFLAIKVFSGDQGSYQLSGLPPGEIEVTAARPNFGRASLKTSVSERESLTWDPVLSQDLELRGSLGDEDGAGLEGFVILLDEAVGKSSRKGTQKKATTDASGEFVFKELSDLDYRITVFEKNSPFACARLDEVRPGSDGLEIPIDRSVRPSAYLFGRVLDSNGNPFPDAKVICFSALGGYCVYFTSKDGGGFRAGPLPRGRYTLEIQARGHPALSAGEHEVQAAEERDVGAQYLQPALR
ncbi:MAG TPA: carboxypeptidase regulatory-like domain-containing protein, partial [Planctomycetota bacterium]|nr:carboxypeptidase regulatory-like domain-containing protein [Planctomycetota bacterium]